MTRNPGLSALADDAHPETPLRAAITRHTRAPEPLCVAALIEAATLPPAAAAQATATALQLIAAVRGKGARGPVEGLIREYDLSTQEGVALMCLAEALLRIPDPATRDALIRDKIGAGDWRTHLGHSPSLFVNAATWGLVVTGRLAAPTTQSGLGAALTRLIARGGEPVIRRGVDMAMRMMGEQFVTGEDIAAALRNARRLEARGFRYSYDMLGEAAATAADAARYDAAYTHAIHAIGAAANGRGLYDGPGISTKLSALHPRYARPQRARVMAELLPRLRALALLAQHYGIGLNIDAEEADRLDLSLDLLEGLCLDPAFDGFHGIGFVVQAYQKRAPFVLDWLIDLARRSRHRLMVRLVKGAYWDTEIKRAQVDGLDDFPVFTRKLHTDVSYLACAQKLLANTDAVFPQFATHNAYTVAAVLAMAAPPFAPPFAVGQYEFQCLHGMGEPLYEEVVGHNRLDRPCRIYAPVGTHETLLAYLVRRLLENGANSSFVNRIQDPAIPAGELAADPVAEAAAAIPIGAPHPAIALPPDLFAPTRRNAAGLDLHDEQRLAELADALHHAAGADRRAGPAGAHGRPVRNPADHGDVPGQVAAASDDQVDAALATAAAATWPATLAPARAAHLRRAADLFEADRPALIDLIVREAGRSLPNAVSEIREAVDFLRYYADQAAVLDAAARPLGPVSCISPWNFPLAIFTGQVAAALAAGNPVLAKPAAETPLVAARATALLHQAGIPSDALQLLPGPGSVGARLVADPRTHGVVFTGSTAVARNIARQLARRLNPGGAPVPLVAETGGQNAMIVDSSALAEQVVADVLLSAFDSAGQRCSALRVLCLQEDVADRILAMLQGAMAELAVGDPRHLATDIGPVITSAARDRIEAHVDAMRAAGCPIHRGPGPDDGPDGTFVPPAIIEIRSIAQLTEEVFGPVLHVLRFRREDLDTILADIARTGYGLTFGLHSRIDDTIDRITAAAQAGNIAGNIYINRNVVGAVVGTQPFGGYGLSGAGPKAGGPLYLRRLLAQRPPATGLVAQAAPPAAAPLLAWLQSSGFDDAASRLQADLARTAFGVELSLPGPVGERNIYTTHPRGPILCIASDQPALLNQIAAALATGNRAWVPHDALVRLPSLPAALQAMIVAAPDAPRPTAILFEGSSTDLLALAPSIAEHAPAVTPIHVEGADRRYPLEWLLRECVVSTNTTAAGGNANLMMLA